MTIEIRFVGLQISDSLRDHAVRRIHLRLRRFARDLLAVRMRLSDVNGPRGGVDKRCQITVLTARVGSFTLDELRPDPYAATNVAVERIARTLVRALERARRSRPGGSSVRG